LSFRLGEERYSHAFRYLEILYKHTCTSQQAGDEEMYKFIGTLFFDCFQVYLRPIRAWMEDGDLTPGDRVFFVSRATGEVDPAKIWQSQFKLRQTQDGKLHAPTFLRALVNKIFTTGKSVVVLKQLKKFSPRHHLESDEPLLNFESVCNTHNLAPFTELFAEAFDAWIQSKHHHASTTLRRILFDSCGLYTSLEALSYIYFMSDGANGAAFTYPIFDKLDKLDPSWNDRFNLTELLHDSFGTLPPVNPDRLRTSVLALSRKNRDIAKYRTKVKVLSIIEIKYNLSWPVQIILNKESLVGYQQIFTFLFQIRRSSHIITRRRLASDTLTTSSSSDERALFYSLRTRLLWFIQTLYYYLSCLVLEPGSSTMRTALKEAIDIDTMINVHSAFMKSTLDKALLGSKLELMHKTILKILDLAIKLEDAETVNASTNKGQREEQENRMDLSMASLGLHTPRKPRQDFKSSTRLSKSPRFANDSSDEDEEKVDLDFSILSSPSKALEVTYVEQLRTMKVDFDRLVRFVASGLKGVARAGAGDEAKSWDTLGEMLEAGLGTTNEFPGSFR
jgi:gamma-tubulin complex component 5